MSDEIPTQKLLFPPHPVFPPLGREPAANPCPKCGREKWRKSLMCRACATEKNRCDCGNYKFVMKQFCRACSSSLKTKSLCGCGGLKDQRSVQCRACRDIEPSEKICRGCNTLYPIDAYGWRPGSHGKSKRRSRCKECDCAAAKLDRETSPIERVKERSRKKKEYNKRNPDRAKRWALRSGWKAKGIDPDEVERFIERNGRHKCQICGAPPGKRALAVDHDHQTGELRGILCTPCNQAIGHFRDNPALLRMAIRYLQGKMRK